MVVALRSSLCGSWRWRGRGNAGARPFRRNQRAYIYVAVDDHAVKRRPYLLILLQNNQALEIVAISLDSALRGAYYGLGDEVVGFLLIAILS